MDKLDQGTIINGIRTEKYPKIKAHGIVITASCDLANKKVNKLYYLLGIKAEDWVCSTQGFKLIYSEKKENKLNELKEMSKSLGLNVEALCGFSDDIAKKVIESEVEVKKQKNRLLKVFEEYRNLEKCMISSEQRKRTIHSDEDVAAKFLNKIGKGEIFHYYFLPQKAFTQNGKTDSGIIVDLQEICTLSLDDAYEIERFGIDNLYLDKFSEEKQERLKKIFWLDSSDDYVLIEGNISSPWREHLMQRFSHCFARIGLDGATKSDYEKIINNI